MFSRDGQEKAAFFRMAGGVFIALALCGTGSRASAQQIPRYQPDRPTVSPYLNLLRSDVGPVTSYYGMVRPQLNQQAANQRSAAQTRSLGMAIQSLQAANTTTTSGTGTGAVFRNRSHFFPSKQIGPRR